MKENSRKCSLRGNGTRLGRDSVTGAGGTGWEAGVSSDSGARFKKDDQCLGLKGASEFGLA